MVCGKSEASFSGCDRRCAGGMASSANFCISFSLASPSSAVQDRGQSGYGPSGGLGSALLTLVRQCVVLLLV